MKTLYLMRHAKSDWSLSGGSDHDRVLTARGEADAGKMSLYLQQTDIRPDVVLCSSAKRTCQTLSLMDAAGFKHGDTSIVDTLYLASPTVLSSLIRSQSDAVRSLLVIAHNPGLHELAVALAHGGATTDLQTLNRKYPAGSMAELAFDTTSWANFDAHRGHLQRFIRPKALLDRQ